MRYAVPALAAIMNPLRSSLLGLFLIGHPADAQTETVLVGVVPAEVAAVAQPLPLTGTVTPARISAVSAEVAGKVARVHVEEGDRIEPGGVLAALDNRRARIAVAQAQAATREAEAALADAQRRFDIATTLAGRQAISDNERRTRETEVQTDRAVRDRRKAEENEQALLLELHDIRAPFAGVVARRLTDAGAWVEPGDAVVELVELRELRIDVAVPQAYFTHLSRDIRVTVRLDAQPHETFEGRLLSTIPVADPGSRTFPARVSVANADANLMPGLSATVTLHLPTASRHVTIPRDALLRHPDGRTTAWVVENASTGATAAERVIEIGNTFDGRVEVRSGLSEGDLVVVEGNEGLRPGLPVQVSRRGS